MKREDAFRKLRLICQRLDAAPPDFPVVPLQLYLYGSVLSDKPNPSDLDLLFRYRERPDLDPYRLYADMIYGKPLPIQKAITHLRRGMKMVRCAPVEHDTTVERWLRSRAFDPSTPLRLVWEPGAFAWDGLLLELEVHPLVKWDPATEEWNDYLQETARRILREQGEDAALAWVQAQKQQRCA